MYCGQCGTENNEEAGHCETCGAPLLITAGARTCSACGASLGDHDRFCPTCGVSADESRAQGAYDATDSFDDIDIDEINISELPPWLQEMAPGESTSAGPATSGQPTPDDLPDWLRDTEDESVSDAGSSFQATSQPSNSGTGVHHQPAEAFSLVSDDDLPDWLKALGEDEPEPEAPPRTAEQPTEPRSESNAVALIFEVPPISRAWLTQGRRVDPSQFESAQQEFSPLSPVTAEVDQRSDQGTWSETEEFETAREQDAATGSASEEVAATSRKRNTMRLVIFVLLVIVLIVLGIVYVQGM